MLMAILNSHRAIAMQHDAGFGNGFDTSAAYQASAAPA